MEENLFRLFRCCSRTWAVGAVVFCGELIYLSKNWKELGFARSCPFLLPDPDELACYKKDYKRLQAAGQLKDMLSSLLNIPNDG